MQAVGSRTRNVTLTFGALVGAPSHAERVTMVEETLAEGASATPHVRAEADRRAVMIEEVGPWEVVTLRLYWD